MFRLIRGFKIVFVGMVVLAFLTALPIDYAIAAIIDTQTSQWEQNPAKLRAQIMGLLAREDVRVALLRHGLNPAEAEARIAAMTDDEIATMANTVNDMPVGGETWGGFALFLLAFGLAAVLVMLLLIALGIWGGIKLHDKYKEQKEPSPETEQSSPAQPSTVSP
jgi:hypothetical protein